MLDLSIVIVNHNTRQLLLECLESIYGRPQGITYEVIVVDNASPDGSVEAVRAQFPDAVVIANTTVGYFAEGNNQGIAVAQGRYILALNPDTLVLGGTLAQLVQQMDAHPDIGAATTIQYTADRQVLPNASRQVTYGYLLFQYSFLGKLFPRRLQAYRDWLWYEGWDRTIEREVGVMPGSCIIAAQATWKAVGGFNEKLLMYFTEDQLSGAVQRLGKRTAYLVTDGIVHYEGASTFDSVTRVRTARALNLYFRDLLAYTALIFGRPAQFLLAIMILPTWIVQRLKAR